MLVLGGCGFIGRHLVTFLVERRLASRIIIADKSMPATSNLSNRHKLAFDNKQIVQFIQSDLSKDAHIDRAFAVAKFDFVVNLCGETRFGLAENDYKVKCLDTAVKAARAAAKAQVKKFIEISTAQVYESTDKPSAEQGKLKPWTLQAKYRLQAEEEIKKIPDLKWLILRPATVYGPGDLTGFMPRAACAAVYKHLNEKMKFLWDKSLRVNAVHVDDVVRAIWLACTEMKVGSLYNLADQTDLDQGRLNGWLGELFRIETGFLGSLISNLAKMNLASVAEDANEKHVPGWTRLCSSHNILNTPISAYIDKELLYNNSLCVDGTQITKDYGGKFKYEKQASKALVEEEIRQAIADKYFPPIL